MKEVDYLESLLKNHPYVRLRHGGPVLQIVGHSYGQRALLLRSQDGVEQWRRAFFYRTASPLEILAMGEPAEGSK